VNNGLPLGTVIKLKNDDKYFYVIIGKVKDRVYSYICVKYPYGFIEEELIEIKETDIKGVVFMGNINY